mmetsp:Transcript_47797/g.104253  ORF Transcript_47797/g.104253 Transcript_47797/m.104253 type:complete len:249 (+) Transcript_47797:589-1335(+)
MLLPHRICGDLWHGVILIVQGDVVDQILVFAPHLLNAVLDDIRHLVCKGGIPTNHCGIADTNEQGMAILMLKPLTIQGGSSSSGTQKKSACARIGGLPNDVAHALEAKHGVVDEEGHHRAPLRCVRSPRSNPSTKSASFADPFLQDLPIRCLGIFHQDVVINWRVVLPERCMDLELVEERIHAKGPGLVRDHGYASSAKLSRLHQPSQQGREGHCGAHFLWTSPIEQVEQLGVRQVDQATDLGRSAKR